MTMASTVENGRTFIVDVRGGDLGRERHTSTIGEDVTLDARLASVRRVGSGSIAALGCLHDRAVERRPLPVDATHVVVEPDELLKESSEDTGLRPRLESRVTGRSRSELRRQRLPLRAGPQAVHDAGQYRAIRNRRPSSPGSLYRRGQQRLDLLP